MVSDYNRRGSALRIAVGIAVLAILLLVGSAYANPSEQYLPDLSKASYKAPTNPFGVEFGGQCTAFAWGRAHEKLGIELNTVHHGKTWLDETNLPKGNTAQANAIAVWGGDSVNPYGHVAFVEAVTGDNIIINEANVETFKKENGDWGGGYDGHSKPLTTDEMKKRPGAGDLLGYIYLDFSASGRITQTLGIGVSGVTMTFTKLSGSGTLPVSVETDTNGYWVQSNFRSDTSYRVTPYKFGYTFTPSSLDFNSANTKLDFTKFTTVTVDESPKQTDWWDIWTRINGIITKAKEVFNEYIRIPEAKSALSTLVSTYTPTTTHTVLPILSPIATQTTTPTLTPVITPTSTSLINTYELSSNGLQFIAMHEGFRPQLYDDAGGHCTIGYGHLVHTGTCNGGEPADFKAGITQTQGIEILNSDVQIAVKAVNSKVIVQLNQNQFDAMVSFTFNIGAGGFSGSTVLNVLNAGKYENVPTELNRYVKSGGKQIQGLVNRRKDEGVLFMTPVIPNPTLNDPYAGVRAVFGPQWTPASIFVTRGLVNQGIYGAVNIDGGIDVYTIGPGGTKETPESYYQKFGTYSQDGIVGTVTTDQARRLGINV